MEGLTADCGPADGLLKLGGTATGSEALERAVLIAGNMIGGAGVNANGFKAPDESKGIN